MNTARLSADLLAPKGRALPLESVYDHPMQIPGDEARHRGERDPARSPDTEYAPAEQKPVESAGFGPAPFGRRKVRSEDRELHADAMITGEAEPDTAVPGSMAREAADAHASDTGAPGVHGSEPGEETNLEPGHAGGSVARTIPSDDARVSCRVRAALYRDLKILAARRQCSVQAVMREALAGYLNRNRSGCECMRGGTCNGNGC